MQLEQKLKLELHHKIHQNQNSRYNKQGKAHVEREAIPEKLKSKKLNKIVPLDLTN